MENVPDSSGVYYTEGGRLDDRSFRLLRIVPNVEDAYLRPFHCDLRRVGFTSRPKFEALSYMWGAVPDTKRPPQLITVNSREFQVGRNLYDALWYLRCYTPAGTAFWVDAICINQEDIEERNRQVRIMDDIFFRASTVVIWLGYVLGGAYWATQRPTTVYGPGLISNGYWKRLWVLQEIGRARRLRVCFDREEVEWDKFIAAVGAVKDVDHENNGPLRLNRLLREERYGQRLYQLLQDHKDAECSEPRDKIYGLLGLAIDAAEFPVDYGQPLLGVWLDAMSFLQSAGDLDHRDPGLDYHSLEKTTPAAVLVKRLLFGTGPRGMHNALLDFDKYNKLPTRVRSFLDSIIPDVRVKMVGRIERVGPEASEIVSEPLVNRAWARQLQTSFQDSEKGEVIREHDRLLEALYDTDEQLLVDICCSRPTAEAAPVKPGFVNMFSHEDGRDLPRTENPPADSQQQHQVRTFMMRDYWGPISKDGVRRTVRKLGVSAAAISAGDTVCWVYPWDLRKALVLRASLNDSQAVVSEVVGTALLTEDLVGDGDPDLERRRRDLDTRGGSRISLGAMTLFTMLE